MDPLHRKLHDPPKQLDLNDPLLGFKPLLQPRTVAEALAGETPLPAPPPIPPILMDPELMEVHENEYLPRPQPVSIVQEEIERFRRIAREQMKRKLEALKLYEPLPMQAAFHASKARERIVRGSNRAGKTLATAVEVARAVTGQDPYGKYPKENGRCFIVGKDGKHIGQVLWKKLANAGAYRIIRDELTNQWRSFRPDDPRDRERIGQSKPSPPLIPPRMITSIGWENKKENQPNTVKLANGWEIVFFSSLGKPPQGSDIDLAWFDEEIVNQDWYPEISARLVDRRGAFFWSATPQAGTQQLYELHERSEDQKELPEDQRTTEEFVSLIEDNAFIGGREKRDFAAKLTDDDRAVRIGGEFAMLSFKVFPEYTPTAHCCDPFPIPETWTRFASIDPGRQICAVLFGAVPPPDEGRHVYLYNELYLANCDAELFGERMRHKCEGQMFEDFLIDHQYGRIFEAGSGRSIEEQYSEALRKRRIACHNTGSSFTWGGSDVKAGVEAVRAWLRPPSGQATSYIRVMRAACPNFDWEMKHWRYKRVGGITTDDPEHRGRVHLMACVRYLALHRPQWVHRDMKGRVSGAVKAFREKQKKQRELQGTSVNLGPGA